MFLNLRRRENLEGITKFSNISYQELSLFGNLSISGEQFVLDSNFWEYWVKAADNCQPRLLRVHGQKHSSIIKVHKLAKKGSQPAIFTEQIGQKEHFHTGHGG